MNAPDRRVTPLTNPAPSAGATAGKPVGDGRLARGSGTRERLRDDALRLFAEKGYAQTSTREICLAAGANAASIHYYFGDKAGLYRDVYLAPILQLMNAAAGFAKADESFESIMRKSYEAFLAPLKHADLKTMHILKLHFREQADPTGLVGDEVLTVAQVHSDAMVAMLGRELDVDGQDDDLRRLATSLIAMAADFLTSAEWIRHIAPSLYADAEAIDRMTDRLTGYAVAMLDYEHARRHGSPG